MLVSTVQRQDVRADAARQMPAAGEQSAQAAPAPGSSVTRAEVRAATRYALANGFHIATGDNARCAAAGLKACRTHEHENTPSEYARTGCFRA